MWNGFHLFLIKISILLIPFIFSVGEKGFFSGAGTNASFYPLLLGSVIWVFELIYTRGKVFFPRNKSFKCMMIFIFAIFLSGIVNCSEIHVHEFQGVSGPKRYFSQFATQVIYLLFAIYIYNILNEQKREVINILKKYILLSFVIAGLYSLIEIARNIGIESSAELLYNIDSLFRSTNNLSMNIRIRSLTIEASTFGMYACLVFPWLICSLIGINKQKRIFFAFAVLYLFILLLFSISRTAYIDIGVELLVFVIALRRQIWGRVRQIVVVCFLLSCFIFVVGDNCESLVPDQYADVDIAGVFLSVTELNGGVHELSNVARFGSQRAALAIWEDNPFFGVGYGCFGFYVNDYYPNWAWISPEIVEWSSESGAWPPVHGLYARLLAETGLLGCVLVLMTFFTSYREILCMISKSTGEQKVQLISFFVCFVSLFMFGFNFDGFSMMPYWIFWGCLWSYRDGFVNL